MGRRRRGSEGGRGALGQQGGLVGLGDGLDHGGHPPGRLAGRVHLGQAQGLGLSRALLAAAHHLHGDVGRGLLGRRHLGGAQLGDFERDDGQLGLDGDGRLGGRLARPVRLLLLLQLHLRGLRLQHGLDHERLGGLLALEGRGLLRGQGRGLRRGLLLLLLG